MKPNHSTLNSSRTLLPLLAFSALPFLISGCGSYPESNVVSAPPPQVAQPQAQVVVTQPAAQVVTATPNANGQLVITQAPPMQQQQTVVLTQPARPSASHVWVDGYWTWKNDRYEWIAAHWEVPPFSGAKWVAPRSEQISNGNYRFYEGYWN
jgi:hypothetical protein